MAQLPTIELTSLSRSAGQVGSTFEVQLNGGRLDELSALTFTSSGDAVTAVGRTTPPKLLRDQPESTNSFNVAIAESANPGLIEVRAVGRFGLSNPRRLLITAKPVRTIEAEHSNLVTAALVSPEEIIFDRCTAQKLSFFQVNLPANSQLSCVAFAQQIDSKATLNMLLLDSKGKELKRSHTVGVWPAEITYESRDATEVYVAIHDFLYQGGADFPFLMEAAVITGGAEQSSLELNQLLRPKFSTLNEGNLVAGEKIDDQQTWTPPFAIHGHFNSSVTNIDFFAKAQQQLSLRVISAAAEQLTDPRAVLYKLEPKPTTPAGEADVALAQIMEQDDAPTVGRPDVRIRQTDPAIVWTVPADGTYRISVRDNQAGARPLDSQQFAVTVGEAKPHFRLLAYRSFPTNNPAAARAMGSNLMRGGTEAVQVVALREDGYAGPIDISIDNLPAGVTCKPMVMPANVNEATLILQASDDASAGHGELLIIGRAKIGELDFEAQAQSTTVVWPAVPTKNAVQYRDSTNLMVAVNAFDMAPLLVELGDGSVTEIAQGAKATIAVKANRREGGMAECLLRPQYLPPGVTLGELKIPADQSELAAELAVGADAPIGEYTWWMQNETKVKYKPNPQAVARQEAYLAQLQAAISVTNDETELQKLNAAITAETASLEELKKQSAEQEFTVWLPSTPHRVRIISK